MKSKSLKELFKILFVLMLSLMFVLVNCSQVFAATTTVDGNVVKGVPGNYSKCDYYPDETKHTPPLESWYGANGETFVNTSWEENGNTVKGITPANCVINLSSVPLADVEVNCNGAFYTRPGGQDIWQTNSTGDEWLQESSNLIGVKGTGLGLSPGDTYNFPADTYYTKKFPNAVTFSDGTKGDLEITKGNLSLTIMNEDDSKVCPFYSFDRCEVKAAYDGHVVGVKNKANASAENSRSFHSSTSTVRVLDKNGNEVTDAEFYVGFIDIDAAGYTSLRDHTISYQSSAKGLENFTINLDKVVEKLYMPASSYLSLSGNPTNHFAPSTTIGNDVANSWNTGFITKVKSGFSWRSTVRQGAGNIVYFSSTMPSSYNLIFNIKATTSGNHPDGGRIDAYVTSDDYDPGISTKNPANTHTSYMDIAGGKSAKYTIHVDPGYVLGDVTVDGIPTTPTKVSDSEYYVEFNNINANHEIDAKFNVPYNITTEVENGTIDPSVTVYSGDNTSINYQPKDAGYRLSTITVDGTPVDISTYPSKYDFNNVQADHHIKVVYVKNNYKITTEVVNGSINPEQEQTVEHGDNATVSYTPNEGYRLKSVTVDGNPVSIDTYKDKYDFNNVTADHHVKVVYEKIPYVITTEVENGRIDPDMTVEHGDNARITYEPNEGYQLSSITVDGNPVDKTDNPSEYLFNNVTANHNIKVVYEKIPYVITTGIVHGNITPNIDTEYGKDETVEYTPDEGYYVTKITVDGKDVPVEDYPEQYDFKNIKDNHDVQVVCERIPYVIETEVENGTIDPDMTVLWGDDGTINYQPNDGYQIVSVTVDGDALNPQENPVAYTFKNVKENHKIKVVYEKIPQLKIEKTTDKKQYNDGDEVEYTIVVSQISDGAEARNVIVTDRLPEGLTLIKDSFTGEGFEVVEQEDNTYTLKIASLTSSLTFKYKAVTADKVTNKALTNVIVAQAENNPEPVQDDETISSNVPMPKIEKTVSDENPNMNDVVTYTVKVSQEEEGAELRNVVVTDIIPEGLSYVEDSLKSEDGFELSYNEGTITATMAKLEKEATFTFDAKVELATGVVTNVASVIADKLEYPLTDDATLEVKPPKLSVVKNADVDVVQVDDEITYTIEIKNEGGNAFDVTLDDILPEELMFVEAECVDFVGDETQDYTIDVKENGISALIARMNSGSSISFKILAKVVVNADTTITNVATVNAVNNPDGELTDTADVNVFTPKLFIEKDVNKTKVKTGDVVTYTITMHAEDAVAKDAVMTDTLPDGMSYVKDSAKCSDDSAVFEYADGMLMATIPELTDEEVTITFDAKVVKKKTIGAKKSLKKNIEELENIAELTASNYIGEDVSDDAVVKFIPNQKKPAKKTPKKSAPTPTQSSGGSFQTGDFAPYVAGGLLIVIISAAGYVLYRRRKQ